jgi:hypothetical protein
MRQKSENFSKKFSFGLSSLNEANHLKKFIKFFLLASLQPWVAALGPVLRGFAAVLPETPYLFYPNIRATISDRFRDRFGVDWMRANSALTQD